MCFVKIEVMIGIYFVSIPLQKNYLQRKQQGKATEVMKTQLERDFT